MATATNAETAPETVQEVHEGDPVDAPELVAAASSPQQEKAPTEEEPKTDAVTKTTAGKPAKRLRSRVLEKVLLGMIVVIFILVIVLIVIYFTRGEEEDKEEKKKGDDELEEISKVSKKIYVNPNEDLCFSNECILIAAEITKSIDAEVNPCDDFYQYSCGKWLREHAADNTPRTSVLTKMAGKIVAQLKNLLEQPMKSNDIDAVQKAKTLYSSCMNTTAIEELGAAPLKYQLNDLGGWPLTTKNWDPDRFTLEEILLGLTKLGIQPFFSFRPVVNPKDSDRFILAMDQITPRLGARELYLRLRDDRLLTAYVDLIYFVASLLGFGDNHTARQEAQDIVDLEIELINITVPKEERQDRDKLYNPMTLKEVQSKYPYLNWTKYVITQYSDEDIGVTDISDEEIIINSSPNYFEKLGHLFNKTDQRGLVNFALWSLVMDSVPHLGEEFMKEIIQFEQVRLRALSIDRARFIHCVKEVNTQLGPVVGKMYVDRHYDKENTKVVKEMTYGLLVSFNALLDGLDWMDDDTKKKAKQKSDYKTTAIGYQDDFLNPAVLDALYENVSFADNAYFANHIRPQIESQKATLRLLRSTNTGQLNPMNPQDINAFNDRFSNVILIPAALIQPPAFDLNYPRYVNYAKLGMIIGHEITHSFDNTGRQIDRDGNVNEWWSASATKRFKHEKQCLVDQFSNFILGEYDITVNGTITQDENIAAHGGVKAAFHAYRSWVANNGYEERTLPGLNFSPNQLFFINYGQFWCSQQTKPETLNQIFRDGKSPETFRVNGVVRNMEEFATAFNCPVGSRMNPEKKCRVW